MMQGLTLNSIIYFGANPGIPLSKIFQYCPTYIEWIMRTEDLEYCIVDLEKYADLPEPTPFYDDFQIIEFFNKQKKDLPMECMGHPYRVYSVNYALAVMKQYSIQPRKYSEVVVSNIKKTEKVIKESNNLKMQLHKLDSSNPKPDFYQFTDFNTFNPLFTFSEEALKMNSLKMSFLLKTM